MTIPYKIILNLQAVSKKTVGSELKNNFVILIFVCTEKMKKGLIKNLIFLKVILIYSTSCLSLFLAGQFVGLLRSR